MEMKDDMPSWVYWGLWGIKTRKVAMLFVYISIVLTLAIVPVGIALNNYLFMAFILVPLWYWLSIKWVDRNSTWEMGNNS